MEYDAGYAEYLRIGRSLDSVYNPDEDSDWCIIWKEVILMGSTDFGYPKTNIEGYKDPTAHAALDKSEREADISNFRCNKLISVIKGIIDLSGFELVSRIELRDKKTGVTYK